MGIRVNPDGSFDVETVEQALELSRKLANGSAKNGASVNGAANHAVEPASGPKDQGASVGVGSRWEDFMSYIRDKEQQLQVLNSIKSSGTITLPDLCSVLGLKSNQGVAGVMAGITKNAKRAGIAPSKILRSKRDAAGVTTYKAGSLLRSEDLT